MLIAEAFLDRAPGPPVSRGCVVAEARTWINAPFRHQGRTRDGIDCAGLVIAVAHALGLSRFDVRDYRARPDGHSMKAHCDRELLPIRLDAFVPGDVLLFHNIENTPQHLAIVGDYHAGGESLIHAYRPVARVVEMRLDPSWRRFLVAAYALRGVT